jgi:hypothetical protein
MTVEFDGDSEEELPQPGGRPSSRRRLRLDLTVGLVVLAGAVVVGRGLSHDSTDPSGRASSAPAATSPAAASPAADPSSAPTPRPPLVTVKRTYTATAPGGRVTLVPALPIPQRGFSAAQCPAPVTCTNSDAVFRPVRDAVHAVFPNGRVMVSVSVRLRSAPWAGQLWFRQLEVFVGDAAELDIRIEVYGPMDQVTSGLTSEGVPFYSAHIGQYFVSAQIDPAATGTVAKLRRLANDPRLFAN